MPTIRNIPQEERPKFEPGEHDCKIVDAGEGLSKSGDPQIVLEVQVKGLQYPIRDYITFSEGAAFKVQQLAKALGINTEGDVITITGDQCWNKRARVKVGPGKKLNAEGKPYMSILEWLPAVGGQQQAPAPSAFKQAMTIAHPRKAATNRISHDDLAGTDEIPF